MAGPAYYEATINIALNEDWIVPFVYGTYATDGVTVIGIDLTGSELKLEIREQESDNEAIVSVNSPNNGITITNMTGGAFTITLSRGILWRLAPGNYVCDLVRLMANGYQERLIDATATVVQGTSR